MAGVGEDDLAGGGVEDREQAGHEHPGGHLRDQQRVRAAEDLGRGVAAAGLGSQDRMRPGHDERGRHALVGDIADRDADAPAGHLDEVVEVAADSPRRTVVGRDLPFGQVRQLARQELLLDQGGDPHLLLQALAFGGFLGLLANELGDADRRRGLGGERRQQAAIVRRVVLLGQARPQIERPDQLALGDQRHDQCHAGRPKVRHGRRVQFELRELDRTGGSLEVGEERIGLGDVHGDRIGLGGTRGGRRRWSGRRGGVGRMVVSTEEAADRAGQCCHLVPHAGGWASGNRYGVVEGR